MPLACPNCGRPNPDDALYCYHDGAAVGGSDRPAGPVAVGLQPFPSPFVFPSGRFCRTFNELALACEAHWEEACELLREGLLESFFSGLGRTDHSWAARRRAAEPDADAALDALLAELPGDARTPALLALDPREINLGVVGRDAERRVDIRLVNQGMGLLRGAVGRGDVGWLTFAADGGAPTKVFQCRHDQTVTLRILGRRLRSGGGPQEGRLLVETNGGTAEVVVRVQAPAVTPFAAGVLAGADSPRALAEKTRATPREAAVFFENGAVARWYEANGWTFPVQGPPATGVAALQQFYEALGLAAAPRVELDRHDVRLEGPPGVSLEAVVVVYTHEKRPVYAHATADVPWLSVGRAVLSGRSARIPVRVREAPELPGERLVGHVHVTANGNQRFLIEVVLTVTAPAEKAGAEAPWRGPVMRPEVRRPSRPGRTAWLLAGAFLALSAFAFAAVLAVVCLAPQGGAAAPVARAPAPPVNDQLPAPNVDNHPARPAAPPPGPDLSDLVRQLNGDDAAERLAAVRELAAMGAGAAPAIRPLLTALERGDADFRRAALSALQRLGAPTRADVEALADLAGDAAFPEGRRYALDALAALGPDALPALAALRDALKARDPATRRKAAEALANLGPDARTAARPDLINGLRDADPGASDAAAAALAKMGPAVKEDAPGLESLLSDKAEAVRRFALNGLRELGPAAAESAPFLELSVSRDGAPELRRLAVTSLYAVRPAGRGSIDAYTQALADADGGVRREAAAALAGVGVAGGALPGLIRALGGADEAVRKTATDALAGAKLDAAQVAELGEALKAKDDGLRPRLLELLRPLKADAAPAVPGITEVLRGGPGEPRRQAIAVAAAMGPAGRRAGPALDDLLGDDKFAVRLDAATALASVEGADAEEAIPVLIDGLRVEHLDDAEETAQRDRATDALTRIGAPAVRPLLSALETDYAGGAMQTLKGKVNALARLAALKALADIGAAAKTSKTNTVLFEISRSDPSREVRNAARQARSLILKSGV